MKGSSKPKEAKAKKDAAEPDEQKIDEERLAKALDDLRRIEDKAFATPKTESAESEDRYISFEKKLTNALDELRKLEDVSTARKLLPEFQLHFIKTLRKFIFEDVSDADYLQPGKYILSKDLPKVRTYLKGIKIFYGEDSWGEGKRKAIDAAKNDGKTTVPEEMLDYMPYEIISKAAEALYSKNTAVKDDIIKKLQDIIDMIYDAANFEARTASEDRIIDAQYYLPDRPGEQENFEPILAASMSYDIGKTAGRMAVSLLLKSIIDNKDLDSRDNERYLDYLERVRRRWEACKIGMDVAVESTADDKQDPLKRALYLSAKMPSDVHIRKGILEEQQDIIGNLEDFSEELQTYSRV